MATTSDVVSFTPDAATTASSQLTAFMRYREQQTGHRFADHRQFDEFSVTHLESFWGLFLHWSAICHEGSALPVCTDVDSCEHALFFPGLRLSYAENVLRIDGPEEAERLAVLAHHAGRPPDRLSRGDLRDLVLRLAGHLRQLGIGPGDRIVAIARNNAEALIAGLATSAVGATFSSVAPDLGASAVLDQFEQLAPVAAFASLTTESGPESGTESGLSEKVGEGPAAAQSVKALIALDDGPVPTGLDRPVHRLSRLLEQPEGSGADPGFERFPFDHPLFVLFSSGTTGRPKAIVHGTGGTLLEHLKEHRLHVDLRPGDRLFFQTSTAWMMWNWQLTALASGAAIVLYDGPVTGADTLWNLVEAAGVTVFGTSPPYLRLCEDSGFSPRQEGKVPALRALLSTGSILHDEQYDWVREHVGSILQSISGGTDIIGCFVLGNPNLPVHRGLIQGRSLGLDVVAMPSETPANSSVGQLVCRNPFPSRPVGFVDDDGARFHESYFSQQEGVWTQGDLIEFTSGGQARMHGRSDGTLNIRGIRVGPAEIYRVLRRIPEISEAMAVEQQTPAGADAARLILLLVLHEPGHLNAELVSRVRHELVHGGIPGAHVPQLIVDVDELPVTHNGKPSERAARDALDGVTVVNADGLRNPSALDRIVARVASADLALEQRAAANPEDASASTETRLQAIWEDILNVAPIGPDDNFFEVGGTSLSAVRLLNAVRERLGVDLPISTLLHAQTIAQMATVADADVPAAEDFPLVLLLKPGTGTAPLFVVHGMHGDVLQMRSLAQLMNTDRPVYGLRSPGLNPAGRPHLTVEAMAEEFVARVREIQPRGPYFFAGYSFGGLIAFEMGSLMSKTGEAVGSVVALDAYLHEGCLPLLARRRFQLLRSLRRTRSAMRSRRRLRIGADAGRMTSPALVSGSLPSGEAMPPRWVRLGEINTRAFEVYRPTPFPGRVVFIRAAFRLGQYCDPIPIWRRLAGAGLVVEPLDCGHEEMFSSPHAEVLAELLTARLDTVGTF